MFRCTWKTTSPPPGKARRYPSGDIIFPLSGDVEPIFKRALENWSSNKHSDINGLIVFGYVHQENVDGANHTASKDSNHYVQHLLRTGHWRRHTSGCGPSANSASVTKYIMASVLSHDAKPCFDDFTVTAGIPTALLRSHNTFILMFWTMMSRPVSRYKRIAPLTNLLLIT